MTEKIILGSAQFGLVYGRTNTTGLLPLEKVAEITKFAADNGVKYIDTARAYGVAEERFGKIFQDDPSLNESINIVTKLATFDGIDLNMDEKIVNAIVLDLAKLQEPFLKKILFLLQHVALLSIERF